MSLPRHHVVALGLALALTANGCSWFHKRKPQTITPQAQAPTVAAPSTEPVATATPPPAEPEPQPPAPASQTVTPKPKPKPRTTRVKKTVIPAPPETPEQTKPGDTRAGDTKTTAQAAPPPRIVIQEGGAQSGNGQLSAWMPHDEATDSQRTTQQLLDATDANLRGLRRALSADERSIVEQIRAYQQQAREAGKDGDLVRAHNLALKAHLLSDELVKR